MILNPEQGLAEHVHLKLLLADRPPGAQEPRLVQAARTPGQSNCMKLGNDLWDGPMAIEQRAIGFSAGSACGPLSP